MGKNMVSHLPRLACDRIPEHGRHGAQDRGFALPLPGPIQRPESLRSERLLQEPEAFGIFRFGAALNSLSLLEVPTKVGAGIEP